MVSGENAREHASLHSGKVLGGDVTSNRAHCVPLASHDRAL